MPRSAPAQRLRYWRDGDLGGAVLASARYGPHDFQRHVHDEMVVAVTEAGAGKVVTRHRAEVGEPGTVWVFAPGESHGGHVQGDRWDYRGFYLDAAALGALARAFCADDAPLSVAPGLYRDPQLARLLVSAHARLERPAELIARQEAWWCGMGLLFGRYGRPRAAVAREGDESAAVATARRILHDRYRENVSVTELASAVGLSGHHLIRAFRRATGLPPHAYLKQVRLVAAKRLLALGRSPGDAALEVGFYDQSHLTRAFRRAYDVTPGQYVAIVRPRSVSARRAPGAG